MNRNNYSLLLGDCCELMKKLPSASIDAVITDPPYLTTDCKMDIEFDLPVFCCEIKRVMRENAWLFVFGTLEMASEIIKNGFKRKFEYVWVKNHIAPVHHNTIRPGYSHEIIYAFIKSEVKTYSDFCFDLEKLREYRLGRGYVRNHKLKKSNSDYQNENRLKPTAGTVAYSKFSYPTTLLFAPNKPTMSKTERNIHPTQKPLNLIEPLVKGYTKDAAVILDPFMGSGTTGVAALKFNRAFIGMETDEKYFIIAKKRIENIILQKKLIGSDSSLASLIVGPE